MKRKLATIQTIKNIKDIPNSDNLQVCNVLGWQIVIKKNEFKENDKCIYCEIDSILPEIPEFEFLRNSKFRIKTIKLKGQISQGICFPISILKLFGGIPKNSPTIDLFIPDNDKKNVIPISDGSDLTEALNIQKYSPPIPAELDGEVKGGFPSFLIKTDEIRIQCILNIIEEYCGKSFIISEKCDGSSTTFYWKDGNFGVCGRNYEYIENSTNSMWKFARQNYLEEKLGAYGRNICLQGEIIGENIQKNRYKIKGQTIKFFRIFDINNYEFLSYKEMVDIIVNQFKLETVPIIDNNYILPDNISEILMYAQGKSILNPLIEREGLVFVRHELKNQGRLSFKVISNKFLINNKE